MSYKIYIGVGHGGSDPGAVYGVHRESDYALDIANACSAELRRHGITVLQSRTADVYESAAAKIKECNAFSPDLAADFHLNAGGGDGFEIYHSVGRGKSKTLAGAIENAVITHTGQNSRGLKTRLNKNGSDYFGFIRQTDCPAVLVEFAFIDSNDAEAVDTPAKRQAMGRAAAIGFLDFLGIEYQSENESGSTAAAESSTVTLPVLMRGESAPKYQIKRIQLCLNQMGWTSDDGKTLAVDGIFGKSTEEAVKKLQKAHGIDPDGSINAKTWRALLVFRK